MRGRLFSGMRMRPADVNTPSHQFPRISSVLIRLRLNAVQHNVIAQARLPVQPHVVVLSIMPTLPPRHATMEPTHSRIRLLKDLAPRHTTGREKMTHPKCSFTEDDPFESATSVAAISRTSNKTAETLMRGLFNFL